jgi:hypothetical protein
VILIATRNDRWDRKTVKWENLDLRSTSDAFSPTMDQASIQMPMVPVEQGLTHTELSSLLRWEDDGGQTI